MENQEKAIEYLKSLPLFSNPEIEKYLTGLNNHNYIFRCDEGKFVLRSNRADMKSENRLRKERRILEFLEKLEKDFAPRSIFFDEDNERHIISFVEGVNVQVNDLEGKALENWVEMLVEIHQTEFENYKDFCERKNYSFSEPETLEKSVEMFGYNRLEKAKENNLNPELTEWAENKLESIEKREDSLQIGLAHGDIADSTRRSGDKVSLIDWEFSGFAEKPEEALAYLYIHEDLKDQKYKQLKQLYGNKAGYQNDLDKTLRIAERRIRIMDVVWSLMKSSQLKSGGNSEWKKYLEQAEKRKSSFEERFS